MSTLFDVVAVLCVAGFAWFVWPPLVLLVIAAAALAASWRATR